jgi:ubiquinone/menaquinone biosynthesis C-methylase UbiE
MNQANDLTRLRDEYENRNHRLAGSDLYSWFNPSHLFSIQHRQHVAIKALRNHGYNYLAGLHILDVGCGSGGSLVEFLNLGVLPGNLYGVDLLFDRLLHAHSILPGSGFTNADGQVLPFPSAAFDLVQQYTAVSSILDPGMRRNICADMLRVLKPSGLILWYDFWLNPTNPQTRGIRPQEIRRLFPNCTCEFHKITLAPPIARRVVPISWMFALFLENLKIFNSHYLAVIRPKV